MHNYGMATYVATDTNTKATQGIIIGTSRDTESEKKYELLQQWLEGNSK